MILVRSQWGHYNLPRYIYINHKKFRHQVRQLWITTLQAPIFLRALPDPPIESACRFWASHLTFSNSASAMILWIHTLFTHMFNPCMGNIPINIIYIYILYYISYIMYTIKLYVVIHYPNNLSNSYLVVHPHNQWTLPEFLSLQLGWTAPHLPCSVNYRALEHWDFAKLILWNKSE